MVRVDPELAAEQAHLDATTAAYDRAVEALRSPRRSAGDELAQLALEVMRRERLRSYSNASGPLYFGRIDRADRGTAYIGRHAVADDSNQLLAINWRAPAAAPFYSATAVDPQGITLRRRFNNDGGAVLGFIDEHFDQSDVDTLTAAIVEDISTRRRGSMGAIVATITPSQYELIRANLLPPLVVQGGPGTGKTAVGLHRAAWLLYDQPIVRREGVLIVGPNPAFMRYIRNVLPALGENSVEQRPIATLISSPAGKPQVASGDALKGSARLASILQRLLAKRLRPDSTLTLCAVPGEPDLAVGKHQIVTLVDEARRRKRSFNAGRTEFRERLAQMIASRVATESRQVVLLPVDDVIRLVKGNPDFRRFVSHVWPSVTPRGLVTSMYRNRVRLKEVAHDILNDSEIRQLQSYKLPQALADMTPADVTLLDEARYLIDSDQRVYAHVVVDEAQNLTEMELRSIGRRARSGSVTLLGDIDQRTQPGSGSSWQPLLTAAGLEDALLETLPISYRVPEDFLRLASAVLSDASSVPAGVRSSLIPPIAVMAEDNAVTAAVDLAGFWARSIGATALILPPGEIGPAVAALEGSAYADARTTDMSSGLNLVDLHSMKGLEIDAAVVVNPTEILATPVDGGPGALYTALTRSTQALAVVYDSGLPPGLEGNPNFRHLSFAAAVDAGQQTVPRRDGGEPLVAGGARID